MSDKEEIPDRYSDCVEGYATPRDWHKIEEFYCEARLRPNEKSFIENCKKRVNEGRSLTYKQLKWLGIIANRHMYYGWALGYVS